MEAIQYKVKNCVLDSEGTIHALLVSESRGVFVPVYLDVVHCLGLLDYFNGEDLEGQQLLLGFLTDSWEKLGFEIKSIVLDYFGQDGYLIPGIVLLQNQFEQRYIYITIFIPISVAVSLSAMIDIPLYITERAESKVKKIDLEMLQSYIDDIGSETIEEDDET